MFGKLIYITGAMPRNCSECSLALTDYNHEIYCSQLQVRVGDIINKDRCPLRNLEEHDENLRIAYTRMGYENGFADGLKAKKTII